MGITDLVCLVLNHKWSNWCPTSITYSEKRDYCEEKRVCPRCKKYEVRYSRLHSWSEWKFAPNHHGETCFEMRVCDYCAIEEVRSSPHVISGEWLPEQVADDCQVTCIEQNVCIKCGSIVTRQEKHTWVNYDMGRCVTLRVCTRCGASETRTDHEYEVMRERHEDNGKTFCSNDNYTCVKCGAYFRGDTLPISGVIFE